MNLWRNRIQCLNRALNGVQIIIRGFHKQQAQPIIKKHGLARRSGHVDSERSEESTGQTTGAAGTAGRSLRRYEIQPAIATTAGAATGAAKQAGTRRATAATATAA